MTPPQRLARRIVLGMLAHLHSGQLTIVEGGERLVFGHGSPQATVKVRRSAGRRRCARAPPSLPLPASLCLGGGR